MALSEILRLLLSITIAFMVLGLSLLMLKPIFLFYISHFGHRWEFMDNFVGIIMLLFMYGGWYFLLLFTIIILRVTFKKWVVFLQRFRIPVWIIGTMTYMLVWWNISGTIFYLSMSVYFMTVMVWTLMALSKEEFHT